MATKMVEGEDKALCSLYLPVWTRAVETLQQHGNKLLPYPQELRQLFGDGVKRRDLPPKAEKLKVFLAKDLEKIREKHFKNTNGEKILAAASFLDPNFRDHSVFKTLVLLTDSKAIVADLALKLSQEYPALMVRL